MRKAVLYSSLAGCFGLAVLLEALVTDPPEEVPANRLVLELGGDAPRTIPEVPPDQASAKTRPQGQDPGGNGPKGRDPDPPGPGPGPVVPPPVENRTWDYTVKDGDSLWTIARDQLGAGARYPEIMTLNQRTKETVIEGEVLKLPGQGPGHSEAPPIVVGGDDTLRTHTLAEGETLGEIAARFLGSATRWPEIADLNGIDDPGRVRAGTVLRIPDA